jgi:hypothetical protein
LTAQEQATDLDRVLAVLSEFSLVLLSDSTLPNVAATIAGTPIKGSWWSHAAGKRIFSVAQRLDERPDVITVKLISGKVTFVRDVLWPQVVAIGLACEAWQLAGLSEHARALLTLTREAGEFRADQISNWPFSAKSASPGSASRELEERLLVYADSIHTESGSHAKRLQTWEHWAMEAGFDIAGLGEVEQAKIELEMRLSKMNAQSSAQAKLPWQRKWPKRP